MNPCIPRTEKEIERYGHLTKLMDLFDGKNIVDIDGKEVKGNKVNHHLVIKCLVR